MANVRVLFTVSPKTPCDNLYIVGSTSSLGNWNPKKATQLRVVFFAISLKCFELIHLI